MNNNEIITTELDNTDEFIKQLEKSRQEYQKQFENLRQKHDNLQREKQELALNNDSIKKQYEEKKGRK